MLDAPESSHWILPFSSFVHLVFRARSQIQLSYSQTFEFPYTPFSEPLSSWTKCQFLGIPVAPILFLGLASVRWGWSQSPKLRRKAPTAYLLAALLEPSATSLYLARTLRIVKALTSTTLVGRPRVSSPFWRKEDVKRNIHWMDHPFPASDNLWASSCHLLQLF